MSLLILRPLHGGTAYLKAAEIFRDMYKRVTGRMLPIVTEDDGSSDLVVIGSDAVNDFMMEKMLDGTIDILGIRYGTDDYCIKSTHIERRTMVILAGGRARSTIYAVYDFFERQADCHYFWDGDVIPRATEISIKGIDVMESPRFLYRGLRYFAHRGLRRFQAEHWSYTDWVREIDWMLKKRLNMFMLRIGMDDLWQRTFPDVVPYPSPNEEILEENRSGYDDRSLFWPLEFRGQLRKAIIRYAQDHDLMHIEDCGTMTHWYGRTPRAFLQAKSPALLSQSSSGYSEETGLVWDIRIQENMDNYMKLTDGYVSEYNPQAELFHTIGLAERNMYEDRASNLRLKLFAYRKIAQCLREKYPSSKLMIGGWDFVGWWNSDEVQQLLRELDPERTIILDYTSEVDDPMQGFQNWGVVGKFPWIFGLFHAYEAESSLRGPYERSNERLKIAKEDTSCKGMVLWPELSHSDILILEYLTENAWSPLSMPVEKLVERLCKNRYRVFSGTLQEIWKQALPIIMLCDWGGFSRRGKDDPDWEKYISSSQVHREMWFNILHIFPGTLNSEHLQAHFQYQIERYRPFVKNGVHVLEQLSKIPQEAWEDEFISRDAVDIARTVLGRYLNVLLMKLSVICSGNGSEMEKERIGEICVKLLDCIGNVLTLHRDYSMYETLQYLESVCPIPDKFEKTLKHNLVNGYCRQYAYEPLEFLYKKELGLLLRWVCNPTFTPLDTTLLNEGQAYYQEFMDMPFETMQSAKKYTNVEILHSSAEVLSLVDNYLNEPDKRI